MAVTPRKGDAASVKGSKAANGCAVTTATDTIGFTFLSAPCTNGKCLPRDSLASLLANDNSEGAYHFNDGLHWSAALRQEGMPLPYNPHSWRPCEKFTLRVLRFLPKFFPFLCITASIGGKLLLRGGTTRMERSCAVCPAGTYTGAMTDEHICGIFGCCGDWNRREVRIGGADGLRLRHRRRREGGDASEYVVKPLMQDAFGGTMDELYDRALPGRSITPWLCRAETCETRRRLVGSFTVVLFGQQTIAFETKTGEKPLALRPRRGRRTRSRGPEGRVHGDGTHEYEPAAPPPAHAGAAAV